MAETAIESLSKGAVPQPDDERDYPLASSVLGAPVIDWSKEFRLPEPPDEDQGSSLSCVAQAWSYFHQQINHQDWSRRDIYSQIFIPATGGAYLRDGGKIITSFGQATRDEAPDPKFQTEANMRVRDDITRAEAADGIEAGYYPVNARNIDEVAQAIRDVKGIVFGVYGTNAGWVDLKNPRPPMNSDPGVIWGHALYGMGFHMHNGQKCIIAKSSWCSTGITEHHIKANYFESGNTFDGWTLIPNERISMPQNQTKIVLGKDGKTVWKAIPVATPWDAFVQQSNVEGIEIPNPIPPASTL